MVILIVCGLHASHPLLFKIMVWPIQIVADVDSWGKQRKGQREQVLYVTFI